MSNKRTSIAAISAILSMSVLVPTISLYNARRAPEGDVVVLASSEPIQAALAPSEGVSGPSLDKEMELIRQSWSAPPEVVPTPEPEPPHSHEPEVPEPTTTTTQPPAPQPVEVPQPSGDCGGLVPTIQAYWPADQVTKVCQVIRCETGGTYSPTIENPNSSASGILQFLDGTWRSARQYVPGAEQYARASHAPVDIQIHVGAEWWARTSWSQWECA